MAGASNVPAVAMSLNETISAVPRDDPSPNMCLSSVVPVGVVPGCASDAVLDPAMKNRSFDPA
jgi:hypothetical protein